MKSPCVDISHKRVMCFVKPYLHDTIGCQSGCTTGLTTGCIVYTNIQPAVNAVVKRVWQPAWQPGRTISCSFNRLSNRVVQPVWQTRFDNRLNVCIHDTASCQTGLTTVLNEQLLSNRVVQPVWQWVWQPVVSCTQTFTRLSTRVNGALSIRSQWNLYLHLHLQQTDRHQSNGFFSRTTWAS